MNGGAYLIHLFLETAIEVAVGRLGTVSLPPGRYVYAGSARRGLDARIARHHRQWAERRSVRRWHIDAVLAHPACHWRLAQRFPGGHECALAQAVARLPGVSTPVPRFGASDCHNGCSAHFLRLSTG